MHDIYIYRFFIIINEYVPNIKYKIHFKLIVKEVCTLEMIVCIRLNFKIEFELSLKAYNLMVMH